MFECATRLYGLETHARQNTFLLPLLVDRKHTYTHNLICVDSLLSVRKPEGRAYEEWMFGAPSVANLLYSNHQCLIVCCSVQHGLHLMTQVSIMQ